MADVSRSLPFLFLKKYEFEKLHSNDWRIENILFLKVTQNQSTYHIAKPKEEHSIKHAKLQGIRSMKPTIYL